MCITNLVKLVILGPPGSGKGTISQWITRDFRLNYISTGDVLRQHISEKTETGKIVQSYISRGDLVPNELIIKLMIDELRHKYQIHNWLLDGFPRTLRQAQALLQNTSLTKVINLNVPDEEIINRIKHRLIHLKSGRIYHLKYNPPKVSNVDDVTGEPLIQRDDDKPEAVKQRLVSYNESTLPVIDFFGEKGLLIEFSGTESNVIYPKIHKYLMDYFKFSKDLLAQ